MTTTRNIYDQHDRAFKGISAYVILDKDNDRIGTIAFKRSNSGSGRLHCYLHVIGAPMVRAHADGGGYDKATAAAWDASDRLSDLEDKAYPRAIEPIYSIREALKCAGGYSWDRALINAGFTVYQAV